MGQELLQRQKAQSEWEETIVFEIITSNNGTKTKPIEGPLVVRAQKEFILQERYVSWYIYKYYSGDNVFLITILILQWLIPSRRVGSCMYSLRESQNH